MGKTYVSFIGRTGKDVEFRPTSRGQVAKFSVARRTGYAQDQVEWINVGVFNEGIQARIKDELPKGSYVAVEGWLEESQQYGKDVRADVVALVQPFQASRRAAAPKTEAAGGYSEDV